MTTRRSINRRGFLRGAGLGSAALFVAACAQPTPAPAPISAPQPTKAPEAPTAAAVKKAMKGKIQMLNTAAYDPMQTATETLPRTPKALLTLRDEYKKLNPEAEIEFVKWPGGEYWSTTLNTWLAGQTAPDVIPLYYSSAAQLYQKGQILNLEPYLAKPNPYITAGKPGSAKWTDSFVPNYGVTMAPDGNHYTIILDAIWVNTYYNKDLFTKLGVTPPDTWAQLIDICKKAKSAGYTPYATVGPHINWMIQSMLWSEKAKEMRLTPATGFKQVTTEEMARAYKKGILTPKDDLWKEPHRLYQELASYMTPGAGAYAKDYYMSPDLTRVFLTGKAPMTWGSGSFVETLKADKTRTWDYGNFWTPVITKETSKYATGFRVGGVIFQGSAMWAVPTFSKNIDLAIDWLMFISKPENISRVVDDGTGGNFAMVNGYEDTRYPAYKEQLDLGFYYITANNFGATVANEYNMRLLPQLMDGQMTVDQFADAIDQLIKANIDQLIADNKWDTSKW